MAGCVIITLTDLKFFIYFRHFCRKYAEPKRKKQKTNTVGLFSLIRRPMRNPDPWLWIYNRSAGRGRRVFIWGNKMMYCWTILMTMTGLRTFLTESCSRDVRKSGRRSWRRPRNVIRKEKKWQEANRCEKRGNRIPKQIPRSEKENEGWRNPSDSCHGSTGTGRLQYASSLYELRCAGISASAETAAE